ncbi:MAG TPA: oligosaccharide flippase family protein, partial [Vicinamibacterales bacterium]|nr:oligosaccharide flippase family protein [Vicinamibacterales bacterium]
LNEILSTMATVLAGVGVVAFAVTVLLASNLERLFAIDPRQGETGRLVLLMIGAFVSIRFPFGVFGAVVYGFQRPYLNSIVGVITSIVVALVNVAVLLAGYGLVELVAATTAVRIASLVAFAWNAWRVYPGLRLSPALFRRERLKEVTGFSVYMLILDWSLRINYSADTLIVGSLLGTAAVAVWTVGARLASLTQQLTSQLNDVMFPLVVDSDASQRSDRLRLILVQGTRLSLALAMPVCVGVIVTADRIVSAWVGPGFSESVLVARVLAAAVIVRIGNASAGLILKGAQHPRLNAFTNATAAAVNVTASILLIQRYGLAGVALATLVPVTIANTCVLFPAACRRVGIGVADAFRQAIWPTAWPAAALAALLWWTKPLVPDGLLPVAVLLAAAALLYELLFFGAAITTGERRFYGRKAIELAGRCRRMPAAAA